MRAIDCSVCDASGKVVRTFRCPESDVAAQPLEAGETLVLVKAELGDSIDAAGKVVKYIPPPPPAPIPPPDPYVLARMRAYPSVQEQLDMLWRAMDTNKLPKVPEFYNAIKAVKDAFPKKPGEAVKPAVIYNVDVRS